MNPGRLLVESCTSIAREARRIAPMAAGIVWGVASVFVLVAISRGFEATQRAQLEAYGDGFLLLRVNKATVNRTDIRGAGFILLDGEDMDDLSAHTPSISAISPKANNWFINGFRGGESARITAVGVRPEYSEICHVPLLPGSRWIDQNDIDQELPVAVIGPNVREQLFPEGEDWHDSQIDLVFSRDGAEDSVVRRVRVIGAIADEELSSDEVYTSHRRVVFLPFTTWERFSPRGFQFFVMRPTSPELKHQALAEARQVLGVRHGFDTEDPGTLVPYFDAIERARQIDAVFGGMEIFFGAVGALILLLGAVGVANVVLMSVAARTFEFGLRRALGCKRRWIFGQVFLEAALVCIVSGLAGFVVGAGGVALMGSVALPEGFAAPRAELGAALLPGVLLLVTSLGAAAWPALRAARMPVVTALHGARL